MQFAVISLTALFVVGCAVVGQPTQRDFEEERRARCVDGCERERATSLQACGVTADAARCELGCESIAARCVDECPEVTASRPLNRLP